MITFFGLSDHISNKLAHNTIYWSTFHEFQINTIVSHWSRFTGTIIYIEFEGYENKWFSLSLVSQANCIHYSPLHTLTWSTLFCSGISMQVAGFSENWSQYFCNADIIFDSLYTIQHSDLPLQDILSKMLNRDKFTCITIFSIYN